MIYGPPVRWALRRGVLGVMDNPALTLSSNLWCVVLIHLMLLNVSSALSIVNKQICQNVGLLHDVSKSMKVLLDKYKTIGYCSFFMIGNTERAQCVFSRVCIP